MLANRFVSNLCRNINFFIGFLEKFRDWECNLRKQINYKSSSGRRELLANQFAHFITTSGTSGIGDIQGLKNFGV